MDDDLDRVAGGVEVGSSITVKEVRELILERATVGYARAVKETVNRSDAGADAPAGLDNTKTPMTATAPAIAMLRSISGPPFANGEYWSLIQKPSD